ncbi:MAG: hypothetical protein C0617_06865 [Desulfuromonas sp.]|uniref:hypothetical protein n=1 Tax=Desulfuromonas sp. TaxID=892 RepID=UPI000CB1149D|nr:hypothetical protein [Desulfuromonas sp.]PLX84740.1 MAG: hypothetical protein C0617_06865 [Desulfuromonas sp.]
MQTLISSKRLANGLVVEFHDASNRYYGDFHRVCIEVRCRIPLAEIPREVLQAAGADPEGGLAVLGEVATFSRTLEKMGVAGPDLEKTRDELVEAFSKNTFPYLETARFLSGMVARKLAGSRKSPSPFAPRS